jgi:hypothetical protein
VRFLLAVIALVWSGLAHAAEWREAETPHFRIYSNGEEKDLRRFSARLEQFHVLLRLATGAVESGQAAVKVRVFLVSNIADAARLHGSPNSDVAGFYSAREDGAIAVVPRATGSGDFTGQVVLFHEYAHHFMLQYTPAVYPSWYVEGFAEIAATASFERKDAITFGKAASHRQYELDYGTRYPVVSMLDGTYLKDRAKGRGWSYGDAWLLTHYLTFSDKRRGQLRAYLNALNGGRKPAEAALVFGDLAFLQREVSAYLAGRSFPYRAVPITEEATGTVTIRGLGAAEAALIEARIELPRRIDLPEDTAEKSGEVESKKDKKAPKQSFEERLAEATRRRDEWLAKLAGVAARYPGEAYGWSFLADAQCSSELYAACEASADRALAIAPGDSRALLRKAEAMIALSKDMPSGERNKRVTTAQEMILKANAANPEDPLPLLAFYRSFAAAQKPASPDGLEALKFAVQLVPQMDGPRLMLAQEFLMRGRLRDARVILRPLAYSPHDSASSQLARELLEGAEAKLEES